MFLKDEEPKKLSGWRINKHKQYKLRSDFPSQSLKQSDSIKSSINNGVSRQSKKQLDIAQNASFFNTS